MNIQLCNVFLPLDESRILRQTHSVVGNGLQYVYYKEFFNDLSKSQHNQCWFTYTINAYYDLAVWDWCMVFGSYNEPTHYKKLFEYKNIKNHIKEIFNINQPEELLNKLLTNLGIEKNYYEQYHKVVKAYRDKYLSHREHHPERVQNNELTFPDLKLIKQSLEWFYLFLIKILQNYPSQPNERNGSCIPFLPFSGTNDLEIYLNNTYPRLNLD